METRELIREMVGRIEQKLEGNTPCYDSHLHGKSHLLEVAMFAGRIAAESGGDVESAVVAALLHDRWRMNDGGGNQHAIDSARFARPLLEQSFPHLDAERICRAIARHADGLTTDDPLEGALWDADRLTLGRVGKAIRPELLSTEAGRRILQEMNSKQKGPTCHAANR